MTSIPLVSAVPAPFLVGGAATCMVVVPGEDTLPVVWAGPGLADGLDPAAVAGAVLAGVGVDLPVLRPMTAAVLYLEAL